MVDLIIKDTRLGGPRPPGANVLEVDQNTPISWLIQWVLVQSARYYGNVRVQIMAHASEGEIVEVCSDGIHLEAPKSVPIMTPAPPGSHGRSSTVELFSPWRGKVKLIELLCCGIAYIQPGHSGGWGDGNLLCMKLAQITQAYVLAPTAHQDFSDKDGFHFLNWQGTVLLYGPSGEVKWVHNYAVHPGRDDGSRNVPFG
ncbi:MAG TPA: hypothetical protein VG675_24945 [Bryobacteraceae bacterium]|nr:hypothetical protein [Bryobacteraceae bacterium]